MKKVKIKCQQCSKLFYVFFCRQKIARFCSKKCFAKSKKGKLVQHLGFKHSKTTKRKMSKIKLGKHSPRKGIFLSNEIKEKISLKLKGRKLTLNTRNKMSQSQKGRHHSLEARKKMSKNNARYWKGKHRSMITREKLRKAHFKGNQSVFEHIRKCFKYREWRNKVFKRDHYICKLCNNQKGRPLNADHYPKSFYNLMQDIIEKFGRWNLYKKAMQYRPLWNIRNGRTLCVACHKKTPNYLNKGLYARINICNTNYL